MLDINMKCIWWEAKYYSTNHVSRVKHKLLCWWALDGVILLQSGAPDIGKGWFGLSLEIEIWSLFYVQFIHLMITKICSGVVELDVLIERDPMDHRGHQLDWDAQGEIRGIQIWVEKQW